MILTPKEEAKEFLSKFEHQICFTDAMECALIAVERILQLECINKYFHLYSYWQEVKEELLIIKND